MGFRTDIRAQHVNFSALDTSNSLAKAIPHGKRRLDRESAVAESSSQSFLKILRVSDLSRRSLGASVASQVAWYVRTVCNRAEPFAIGPVQFS